MKGVLGSRIPHYNTMMNREHVIRVLSEQGAELAWKYGVKSLSLFGSAARDEAGPASDVDLLVEFNRPVGYFGLSALQDHLETLLGCRVDLGTPNSLKPRIRARVMGECVRVAWRLERPTSGYSGCPCGNPGLHARDGFRSLHRRCQDLEGYRAEPDRHRRSRESDA